MSRQPTASQLAGSSLPCDAWSDDERRQRDRLLSFLFDRINYERLPAGSYVTSDFKLQRMEALLERLGNPQNAIPAIHIAGTKGKGTTAHMTADLLRSAGLRVGLFTSPHIHRFEERMTVDGEFASVAQLKAVVDELMPVLAEWDAGGPHAPPTFFEVCTAMAWLLFRGAGVDAVVLEVGLGGRLDATNICRPEVCVITSISRDHTQLLGDDVASIAKEKAGIIKPGVPVISGVGAPEAREVVRAVAEGHDCELIELDRDVRITTECRTAMSAENPLLRDRMTIEFAGERHTGVLMPVPGAHHSRNAAMAVSAAQLFLRRQPQWSDRSLSTSVIASTSLPMRGEVLKLEPLTVVDGAHNEASLQSVLAILAPIPIERRRLIFGVSRDKDGRAMLRLLAGQFAHIVLTAYQSNPRALPLAELARLAGEELNGDAWTLAEDPHSAIHITEEAVGPDDVICITGSMFLGAEAREIILRRRADVRQPVLLNR